MAKKEKVVINNEELMPTVIGTIDNKKTGLIYLSVVFILLILFVFFMPEIIAYYEEYTNKDEVIETYTEDEDKYTYEQNMLIDSQLVTLSNINISDYTLTFDIINNQTTSVTLQDENYYLEVYDAEDNLISRMNFEGITILSGETYNYETELLYQDVSYFKFEKITQVDYPQVILNEDEDGVQTLVCQKENIVITYEFENTYLKTINQKIYIDSNQVDEYVDIAMNYMNISGLTVSITDNMISEYNLIIDTTIYTESNFNEDYLNYAHLTDADVINFELIAKGFDCN